MLQPHEAKKTNTVNTFFTISLILTPVLECYQSPLSSMNMATFLMMPLFVLLVLKKIVLKKSVTGEHLPIILLLYPFLILLNLVATNTLATDYVTYFRSLLWFFTVFVFGRFCYTENGFFGLYRKIILVASVLIIIQGFADYLLGHPFKIWIPSMLRTESYLESSEDLYRPCAFYLEPAHFSQSAILYLSYIIFGIRAKHDYRPQLKEILFVSVAIIISGSGQGYIYLGLLYSFWVLKMLKERSSGKMITLFVLSSLILVFLLLNTSIGQYALSRILPSDEYGVGGKALAGRTYGFTVLETLKQSQVWMGVGAYSASKYTEAYLTSYISTLFTLGILGLIYYTILVLYFFRKGAPYTKVFMILYSIMFSVASVTNISSIAFFLYPLVNSLNTYRDEFDN